MGITDYIGGRSEAIVFDQIKGIRDTYTTASHYDGSQLDVVEAVVIAALQCSGAPLR